MLVLGFPDAPALARDLARALDAPAAIVDRHRFPDRETRLRLPPALPDSVVLCRSLDDPDAKLTELILAAGGARDLGARRLTLVAPYLCYLRQDRAFAPGEVVSQQIVGRLLAAYFDAVLTVDPHLHRVRTLAEAVPAARARALSAAPAMGAFLRGAAPTTLLIGPDREATQWVEAVAEASGLESAVADKVRRGDREVEIRLPDVEIAGRPVVLVDDVASSGHTLATAARALRAASAVRVDVLVTHALFVDDALNLLAEAGVGRVWSSDSVPHESNAFPLARTLAGGVNDLSAPD